MSSSKGALFFRDGDHSMWDLKTNKRRRWNGIRPGCWLNIINAGGIVLAPETSAGCYCANPIQTSVAFSPLPVTSSPDR